MQREAHFELDMLEMEDFITAALPSLLDRLSMPENIEIDPFLMNAGITDHTKECCLVIETTEDRKEYDFHRVLEYYPECSFDSFTIKEYSIIFEHGPEISYLDFHQYIQCKFIQLMG